MEEDENFTVDLVLVLICTLPTKNARVFCISRSSSLLAISSMATAPNQPPQESLTSPRRSLECFSCHRYGNTRLGLEPCIFDDDVDLLVSRHRKILEQWNSSSCHLSSLIVSKFNARICLESGKDPSKLKVTLTQASSSFNPVFREYA
jgi:hypothetical protein